MQHTIRGLVAATLIAASALAADRPPAPARHLIYLHGRIVQDQQSLRPQHAEYGHYEMAAITEALRKHGFTVTAEIRPKGTSVTEAADDVVQQVRRLLASGVAADHITILGASMGAAIALRAAARLQEPHVRFALLGPCLSLNVPAVAAEEGAHPAGRLLVIRDESDISSADCAKWSDDETRPDSFRAREVVIDTGLGHGYLYRPLAAWLDPVAQWAGGAARDQ